jgi:hypothetical protein
MSVVSALMEKIDSISARMKSLNERVPLSANISAKLDLLNNQLAAARQRNSMYDEHQYFKAKEDFRRWRGEEAQARSQAMADAQFCADVRAAYQPVFASFGEHPPMPESGASPESFRRKLMRTIRTKLSPWDNRKIDGSTRVADMARLHGIDKRLDGQALDNFESMMLRAGGLQAEAPHESTLPETGHVARQRVDPQTGVKSTEWFGRRSFIHDMYAPAPKIARIIDPTPPYPRVIWGAPFPNFPQG